MMPLNFLAAAPLLRLTAIRPQPAEILAFDELPHRTESDNVSFQFFSRVLKI